MKLDKTIHLSRPTYTDREQSYVNQALASGKLSSLGPFSERCQKLFVENFGFNKSIITKSGTDALTICAMLLDLEPLDEVIVPSYAYVTTASTFSQAGGKVVFADSGPHNPNIYPSSVETLITPNTRAVLAVHYAGIACEMKSLKAICKTHNLILIEDCAHSIGATLDEKPLGSFGQLAAFSFHETKTISCGEGGLLVVNDERFFERAETIAQKGTNRNRFLKGKVARYELVDVGHSFLISDMLAAVLLAQLERFDEIHEKRIKMWNRYREALYPLAQSGRFELPDIPKPVSGNAHAFYLVLPTESNRNALITFMKKKGITCSFHFSSLHKHRFYQGRHQHIELPNSDKFSAGLVRLPIYFDLTESQQDRVIAAVHQFFQQKR